MSKNKNHRISRLYSVRAISKQLWQARGAQADKNRFVRIKKGKWNKWNNCLNFCWIHWYYYVDSMAQSITIGLLRTNMNAWCTDNGAWERATNYKALTHLQGWYLFASVSSSGNQNKTVSARLCSDMNTQWCVGLSIMGKYEDDSDPWYERTSP